VRMSQEASGAGGQGEVGRESLMSVGGSGRECERRYPSLDSLVFMDLVLVVVVPADPTRRALVDSLRTGEMSVGELARSLDIKRPRVSQHLRRLQSAGIVRARQQGKRRLYSLHREAFLELGAWFREYRRNLDGNLDQIEADLAARDSSKAMGA
jgi:DNA-binding transcriptional ArsR family regulator